VAIITATEDTWFDGATSTQYDTGYLSGQSDGMYGSYIIVRIPVAIDPGATCSACSLKLVLTNSPTGDGLDITKRVADTDTSWISGYADMIARTYYSNEPPYYETGTAGQVFSFDLQEHVQYLCDTISTSMTHLLVRLDCNSGGVDTFTFASLENVDEEDWAEPKLDITISGGTPSGPTTHNVTATGGVKVAGTSTVYKRVIHLGSGGTVASGNALVARRTFHTATGGLNTGGTNQATRTQTYAISGGAKVAGTSLRTIIFEQLSSGGAVIPASYSFVEDGSAINDYATGGSVVSGEAVELYTEFNLYPEGGGICSGTAEVNAIRNPTNSGGVKCGATAKYGISNFITFTIAAGKVSEDIPDFIWTSWVPVVGETIYVRRDGADVPYGILAIELENNRSRLAFKSTLYAEADNTFSVIAMG
jgi:hypothetical protein